jgi:hypothetical protein
MARALDDVFVTIIPDLATSLQIIDGSKSYQALFFCCQCKRCRLSLVRVRSRALPISKLLMLDREERLKYVSSCPSSPQNIAERYPSGIFLVCLHLPIDCCVGIIYSTRH